MIHPNLATEKDVPQVHTWPDTQCALATQDRDLRTEALDPDNTLQALLDDLYPPAKLGPYLIQIWGN